MKIGVAALVAGLFLVSCTGAEPEEDTHSGVPPIQRVRFLKPVGEIAVNPQTLGYSSIVWMPRQIGRPLDKRAEVLVAELRRERPWWLRHIRGVHVVAGSRSRSGLPVLAMVNTGIFINDPGREAGRTICRSLLKRPMKGVSVFGVRKVYAPQLPLVLATCSRSPRPS